jgi:hypothetical protein
LTRGSARFGATKPVDDVTRSYHVEFFPRQFLQIAVVVANTPDALAQRFVFFLQSVILLVQPALFVAQSQEMDCAALTHHSNQRKQYNERAQ